MDLGALGLRIGVFGAVGAIAFLGLTVYPFQYGPVESAVLVGGIALYGLVKFVLDTTRF